MIDSKNENYKKLILAAKNEEDLIIFSMLCQDSIIKISNIKWAKKSKRFFILLTRFCWELNYLSKKKSSSLRRVNSILSFDNVLSVKTLGIKQKRSNMITSLLTCNYRSRSFEEQSIDLVFSGNGKITLDIECIEVFIKDISEPFKSTYSKPPNHEHE
tara:strand:+ start:512 stop:985 length:474 start_codon:yes stop_codon:yes gene_type:complete